MNLENLESFEGCKLVSVRFYDYLAKDICKTFEKTIHLNLLCDISRKQFADNEILVCFEENIRNEHIVIIGETTHSFLETLLIIDSARRNSAREITLILPYYGYSRQDKKEGKRASIAPSLFARIFELAGVNRVVSIDIHSEQILGHYLIPFNHLVSATLFLKEVENIVKGKEDKVVFCTPDAGAYKRVSKYAEHFQMSMCIINKERDKPGEIKKMELIGDVKDKEVIIIDDIMDSGGTLVKANELLYSKGATKIHNFITHAIITKPEALSELRAMNSKLITTNTLPNVYNHQLDLEYINCSELLVSVLYQIMTNGSVISLNNL